MDDILAKAPWVETYEDFESILVDDINESDIVWFDVKISLSETDIEKKERLEAMKEQVKLGIIQNNGLPVGMNVPKNVIDAHLNNRNRQPIIPQIQKVDNIHKPTHDLFKKASERMTMAQRFFQDKR